MDLSSVGHLTAETRRSKKLTLRDVAVAAGVGRSTVAALESGTLTELGFSKISRICAALDLIVDVRPLELESPLMAHRHLTESASRELTKAAIEDVITRGDFSAWRGLVKAIRTDTTGRIARRVKEVTGALRKDEPKARAFANLLPSILNGRRSTGAKRD